MNNMNTRRVYPSDITREKFELIREELESARKKTKPRIVDLYDVFCGLLYVLRSGCQWAMLPSDFPKYRSVHEYFLIWSRTKDEDGASILDRVLKKINQERTYKEWQERTYQYVYH